MPATAKLSRKFYDTLGDEIANEMVNWFNAVDATYRSDLRELNELNFARFDAKMGERITELRADFDKRLSQFDAKLGQRLAEVESRLAWRMFAFWAPTALAVTGTGAGVISLLLRH